MSRYLPNLWRFFVILPFFLNSGVAATVRWLGGSGDWGDAAKWSSGTVPGASDDVVISDPNGDTTVTVSTGANPANSVVSDGTLQVSGGTLQIATTLTENRTLLLKGGTIAGGTINATTGGGLVVSSGTLDGVTVNGTIDVGNTINGATLSVVDGLVLNGKMLLGHPSNQQYGYVTFSGNQVLSGNAEIVFGNQQNYNAMLVSGAGSTLVLGPQVRVRGILGYLGTDPYLGGGSPDGKIVNQGTISSDSSGNITINGGTFSNAGLVEAKFGILTINDLKGSLGQATIGANSTLSLDGTYTLDQPLNVPTNSTLILNGGYEINQPLSIAPGSTLTLNGNWGNNAGVQAPGATVNLNGNWRQAGVINVGGGTLNLGGSFPQGGLGTIQAGGSVVNLTGTINNTNSVLTLDGTTGSWVLKGGTIAGGTINATTGGGLVVSSGTLDGVTVNGTIDVGNTINGATLSVVDGLVLNGKMLLGHASNQQYGYVTFSGNQVLSGNAEIAFGNQPNYNAMLVSGAGSTLVLGPQVRVRGILGYLGTDPYLGGGSPDGKIVNQGTISSDGSGNITISGGTFSNAGLVEARNGGVLSLASGAISNEGRITFEAATSTVSGQFTQEIGTLEFGLGSKQDFGQVKFTGTATISGTISAHLKGTYVPVAGDSFSILNYGSGTLAATNVSFPKSNTWETNYTNGVFTITAREGLPLNITVAPKNVVIPIGGSFALNATVTGPASSYQWRQNGSPIGGATNIVFTLNNAAVSASGNYDLIVSTAGGSLASERVPVSVLAPPLISQPPQSQVAHVGGTVTLDARYSGDVPLAFQWLYNDVNLPGATNSTLVLTNVLRAQQGDYRVVIRNPVGVVTSSPPAVLAISDSAVCPEALRGLVAWWTGEHNSSDYAGTNDAVFEGTTGYLPGEVGHAFALDGVTSYLNVPDSPKWSFGTNDFSIEFWANFAAISPSDPGGDGSIAFIGHDEGPGVRNKWFFGLGGERLYFYVRSPTLAPKYLAQAPFTPQLNTWYHLAVTRESSLFRMYLNGRELSVETNALALPVASAPLTIGQAQGLFMEGALDEVSIYNRALQANELQSIYNNGSGGKCASNQASVRLLTGTSPQQFKLQISGGTLGANLTLQTSPDLITWTNLTQITKARPVEIFSDPEISKKARFYRVRSEP